MEAVFKIFGVGEDYTTYIVEQSKIEALELHNSHADAEWHETIDCVLEVPFESEGRFEVEEGYQNMTFGEFLGKNFVCTELKAICWNE